MEKNTKWVTVLDKCTQSWEREESIESHKIKLMLFEKG